MRLLLAGIAALALSLCLGAAAQQATSGQGQGDFTLDPRQQLHPLPTSLAQGDAIVFDWRVTDPAGVPLYFSQHIHIGAQQLNLTETNTTALRDRLVAQREGLYSILWENHSPDIVTFTYEYHTERAEASGNKAPLPAVAALLGLAAAALLAAARARR